MLQLAIPYIDPVSLVLVAGIVVSFATGVLLVSGRSPRRRPTPPKRVEPTAGPNTGMVTASSALVRANAAARARSSAADRAGHTLTDVRVVSPAGQLPPAPDRSLRERTEATRQAAAIAFHIAEHDPERMAEVITQWIRTDQTKPGRSV